MKSYTSRVAQRSLLITLLLAIGFASVPVQARAADTIQVIYDMTYPGNWYFPDNPIVWSQTLDCFSRTSFTRTDEVESRAGYNIQTGSMAGVNWDAFQLALKATTTYEIGQTFRRSITYTYSANKCHSFLVRVYPGYTKYRYMVKKNGNAVALINVLKPTGVAATYSDFVYIGPPLCAGCEQDSLAEPPIGPDNPESMSFGPPVSVPAISTVGIIGLVLLLGITGILILRRRRLVAR